jgi:hypothetical protein
VPRELKVKWKATAYFQFYEGAAGAVEAVLEWSPDGGATWSELDRLTAVGP